MVELGRRAVKPLFFDVHVFGHVHFAPDNRFNLKRAALFHERQKVRVLVGVLNCGFQKLDSTVHIAVIGHGDSGNIKLVAQLENLVRAHRAVKQ